MTLDNAAEYLLANDSYIVASHDGPDADGLGAAYALVLALRSLGKRAFATVPAAIPAKYRFVDKADLFVSLATAAPLPVKPEDSILIVVDTHDMSYLGEAAERIHGMARASLIIDHHEPKGEPGPQEFIDSRASSSCELVYLLIQRLGAELSLDAAEALFAGMVYDTGSFSYPKTGERTFDFASRLVRAGVQPYAIHGQLYESGSVGVLMLQKAVLATLELHEDNRVAVQTLCKEQFVEAGAAYEDAEDLVNIPLQGRSVEVSLLFKENMEGRLRCSLRSKGLVNVAHIAQTFGGGGHRTAAGFTCRSPLESTKAELLKSIAKSLARSGGS